MLRFVSLTALSLMSVAISAVIIGCSGLPNRGSSRARTVAPAAEVVRPLSTRVERPELLASINSIEIAQPTVSRSAGGASIQSEDARRVLEQVARETMTLKIVSQTGVSKVASKADATLLTEILRFDNRQGSAVGGEPAVVSFKMAIRSNALRQDIWSAQYFLRQEALSENLLRINERVGRDGLGAGWRSAQDVFRRGITAALEDFNGRREQQFLASPGR